MRLTSERKLGDTVGVGNIGGGGGKTKSEKSAR